MQQVIPPPSPQAPDSSTSPLIQESTSSITTSADLPEVKQRKARKERKTSLTPKQRKLVALLPCVALGEISKETALKRAGYSDSTARQQTRMVNSVRKDSAMQLALRNAGVNEERFHVGNYQVGR